MHVEVWTLAFAWMLLVALAMCLGGNASRVCAIGAAVVAGLGVLQQVL